MGLSRPYDCGDKVINVPIGKFILTTDQVTDFLNSICGSCVSLIGYQENKLNRTQRVCFMTHIDSPKNAIMQIEHIQRLLLTTYGLTLGDFYLVLSGGNKTTDGSVNIGKQNIQQLKEEIKGNVGRVFEVEKVCKGNSITLDAKTGEIYSRCLSTNEIKQLSYKLINKSLV